MAVVLSRFLGGLGTGRAITVAARDLDGVFTRPGIKPRGDLRVADKRKVKILSHE